MPADRIKSIVIVGGGASGWLAAAALGRRLQRDFCRISVVDGGEETWNGFTQTTLPSFHRLNNLLGIDEYDVLERTCGAFTLGTQYKDWGRVGERYFHAFGSTGFKLDAVAFHHYWLKLRQSGDASRFDDYSTAAVAATQDRFSPPSLDRRSVLSLYSYGYHLDAQLLSAYLRVYAQSHGVVRVAGKIAGVRVGMEDGYIESLALDDGSTIPADLFIDCSGAQDSVLQRAIDGGFRDWSHWLPCNRSVSVRADTEAVVKHPYSGATARASGWMWTVPLQQGADCGYEYCAEFVTDEAARANLFAVLPGAPLGESKMLSLSPGRPDQFWKKNCITLAGFHFGRLESLELHLVQTQITRLLASFPAARVSPNDAEEYNRLTIMEFERIRDFLILHYKATVRGDSPFWEYCRDMRVPDALQSKIELFVQCGRIGLLDEDHFGEESWLAVLFGQGMFPSQGDPLADVLEVEQTTAALGRMRSMILDGVQTLPPLSDFMTAYSARGQ